MIIVGGLWLRAAKKDGEKYMSGTMGGVRVLVFKNKKKRGPHDPDYTLCFDTAKREGADVAPPDEE